MTKTKEQLEEEKKISLSIRIKPLDLDGMDSDQLRNKANELWDTIVRLETEKYDLEERQKRQDYDVSKEGLLNSGDATLFAVWRNKEKAEQSQSSKRKYFQQNCI